MKIFLVPFVSILTLFLPDYFTLALILILFVISAIVRLSFREQLAFFKPVIYYAFFLFLTKLIISLLSAFETENMENDFVLSEYFSILLQSFSWQNEKSSVFMLAKIFCLLQISAIFFKTTTSLEIREQVYKVEMFFNRIFHKGQFRAGKNSEKSFQVIVDPENEDEEGESESEDGNRLLVTDAISMFINFIPMVMKIYEQSKKVWIARGGKKGIRMLLVLLPVLFSIGMKKAWNTNRAFQSRIT